MRVRSGWKAVISCATHRDMRKRAAIYQKRGTIFVSASHRTQAGFWVEDDQVKTMTQPAASELEAAVRQALDRSQEKVPTPPPSVRFDRPLLKAANVSSWATFMKLSTHVDVCREGDELKITPYRNLGPKEGFEPQKEQQVVISSSSNGWGQVVLDALQPDT